MVSFNVVAPVWKRPTYGRDSHLFTNSWLNSVGVSIFFKS